MRRKGSGIVVRTAFQGGRKDRRLRRVGEGLRDFAEIFAAPARGWCVGRNPWVRLPLLLWGVWILSGHLRSGAYQSLFGGLNFGLHELGHIVFAPLGHSLGVAGGTLAELDAPFVGMAVFFRQRDWFAIAFCWLWLGTALHGVARYVADARAQALPLVSPFPGEPIHDWNYLLGKAGLLGWDRALGWGIAGAGTLAIVAFLAWGGWMLWQMWRNPERAPELTPPWG